MKNFAMVLAGALYLLGFNLTVVSQNSVLSEGSWYKISVNETGVHQITYDDLVSYGIDPSLIDPQNIRIYGNGNGMLPEANDATVYQDLQENAIFVLGEGDGVFDATDYILFYGQGPALWNYNPETGYFEHETNLYTTVTCYFINFDTSPGKRIEEIPSSGLTENGISNSFDDYYYHELEEINLIHSGKKWVGETFDETLTHSFQTSFPNQITEEPFFFKASAISRSTEPSTLLISINDSEIAQIDFTSINPSSTTFARDKEVSIELEDIDIAQIIKFEYLKPNDSAIAWLDYFELNAKRDLIFEEGQMAYRDKSNSSPGNIIRYEMLTNGDDLTIWNVTDPLNVHMQDYIVDGDGIYYKTEVGGIEEFIVFDGSEFMSVDFVEEVSNQNLQAIQPPDLIIITHEDFNSQAQELAQLHQNAQGLSVAVVEVDKIYNEFSSGVQDVSAIRNFIKLIYQKQTVPNHMNVLLFGNTSYDYLNRIENNTNFIPCWQSEESLKLVSSYCTDDYFGIFEEITSPVSIGIGRLPVSSSNEANTIIDKINQYITNNNTMGNWRNRMCFVADDEDANLHLNQVEDLIESASYLKPETNVTKIYLDAFVQEETPDGPRYPEVNQAITDAINDGVNIINYTGHGSYMGWAMEQVFEEDDLENWTNQYRYPLLVAATADFGRTDDPEITSLAVKTIFLENKGSIGAFAANRLSYAGANFALQESFYTQLLNNSNHTLGEIIKMAKQQPSSFQNTQKFGLLGDPALPAMIPFNDIVTETVNGIPVEQFTDTIHPGEEVILSGFVTDQDENILTDFDGSLTLSIYDAVKIDSTLGNDENSYAVPFTIQDDIVFTVDAEVNNGQFELSFNYPNNAGIASGNIKLSYYAQDDLADAAGYFDGITVGGLAAINNPAFAQAELLNIYPSVATSRINYEVQSNLADLAIRIYDIRGVCVKQLKHTAVSENENGSIDISGLQKGLYLIKATSLTSVQNLKFIKK